ncbi:MAG: hypothetical protein JNJ89_01600 [Rubrivivax sp.]|nr:hypothetical protein [Rubrivivax sp.]
MSFLHRLLRDRGAKATRIPWLSLHAGESALLGAVAKPGTAARPCVQLMPPAPVPADSASLRAWRESCRQRVRATVVLRSSEYRVLPIEPPPLSPAELREAARWQVADALDFPVEDAAIDVLAVPAHAGSSRNQRFVVATPNQQVLGWLGKCKEALLPLGAVDIPEMAMRNLSVQVAGDAPHAFLYIGFHSTRLALIWKRELCSFRQLDLPAHRFVDGDADDRDAVLERLALEIQRTADSFSRQFAGLDLEVMWLASVKDPQGLADRLSLQVPQRVQVFDVAEHVQVEGGTVVDATCGRDYLLAIGAALRQEAP